MPAVQIRNMDQELYDQLTAEAKANGRSITRQLEAIAIAYFEAKKAAARAQEAENAAAATARETANQAAPEKTASIGYANPFARRTDADEVIEARRKKRERLFAEIASRHYPEFPEELDPVKIVREARDSR